MAAALFDIVVEQGAKYERIFSWDDLNSTPIDMTGWTARMQIRSVITSDVVLADLSTENGGITLNYGGIGLVRLLIRTKETSKFDWSAGVYDLEVYDLDFECYRLLKGKIKVDPQVTRVPQMVAGKLHYVTSSDVVSISGLHEPPNIEGSLNGTLEDVISIFVDL